MNIQTSVRRDHQTGTVWQGSLLIGTDTGGTFTDCIIAGPHGLAIGKALSTPNELWRGIIASIEDAAREIGGIDQVLSRTSVLAHGTTAMLNATLTGAGATVGIITTAGFEDTLSIGRVHQKIAGLAEWERTDLARLKKSSLFRDKRLIEGIHERVDARGEILRSLDRAEVKAATLRLREKGATAFAVNFLWSCVNPANERAAMDAIRDVVPEARVTCSSDLSTTIGEYERFATCALNAYIGDIAGSYLQILDDELRRHGFGGRILVTRAWGDLEPAAQVSRNSVPSLFSGPIGGVVGARALADGARGELPLLLCADLGGTSLDVAVVHEGNVHWNRHPVIERLNVAVPTFEIASIGTGGGSIASFESELGLIHVGPQSAGGNPGPACYQRGGTKPTLTDAALVAGWLPPGSRMPGGIALSEADANAALEREIAIPSGLSLRAAAASVLRIASAQMADLIRKACIERSVDPRRAVPLVYGGAGAQYAGAFCSELGISRFLVPELASAFSAFGMLGASQGSVKTRSIHNLLPLEPGPLEAIFSSLQQELEADIDNVDGVDVRFERFAELRYNQQATELRIPCAVGTDLGEDFTSAYERRYGAGASDQSNQIELTTAVMRAALAISADQPMRQSVQAQGRGDEQADTAFLWIDGVEYIARVQDFAATRQGNGVTGPAIVTANYTSVVIPPGWTARWRDDINLLEVVQNGQG